MSGCRVEMAAWLPDRSRRGDRVAETQLVEEEGVPVCCLVDDLVERPGQVARGLQPQQHWPARRRRLLESSRHLLGVPGIDPGVVLPGGQQYGWVGRLVYDVVVGRVGE